MTIDPPSPRFRRGRPVTKVGAGERVRIERDRGKGPFVGVGANGVRRALTIDH